MGVPMLIAGIAGIAGAGINAMGQMGAMNAQSANAAYKAQVAANNQKIALENAGMETQSGEINAGNRGLKTRAQIGATKAGEGASGVDVNTGSFAKARASEAERGMTDALTIRSEAAKKAWAYETQAANFGAESQLDRAEADQASAAAPWVGIGSFLSSASSVGEKYWQYTQQT